jgi:hypothetical protein
MDWFTEGLLSGAGDALSAHLTARNALQVKMADEARAETQRLKERGEKRSDLLDEHNIRLKWGQQAIDRKLIEQKVGADRVKQGFAPQSNAYSFDTQQPMPELGTRTPSYPEGLQGFVNAGGRSELSPEGVTGAENALKDRKDIYDLDAAEAALGLSTEKTKADIAATNALANQRNRPPASKSAPTLTPNQRVNREQKRLELSQRLARIQAGLGEQTTGFLGMGGGDPVSKVKFKNDKGEDAVTTRPDAERQVREITQQIQLLDQQLGTQPSAQGGELPDGVPAGSRLIQENPPIYEDAEGNQYGE